jgi:hypothetical protein
MIASCHGLILPVATSVRERVSFFAVVTLTGSAFCACAFFCCCASAREKGGRIKSAHLQLVDHQVPDTISGTLS